MHVQYITIESDRFPDTNAYPFNITILRKTEGISLSRPVTFFVGENGSGKSTLLKAIAKSCGIHIWSEEISSCLNSNRYEQDLYQYIRPSWSAGRKPGSFFAAEHYDHLSKLIETWAGTDPGLLSYFGGKSLLTQSHGESFMSFFRSRYSIEGLYLLDEPETALSPKRQLEFLELLSRESTGTGNVQFIIATHSTILLSCPLATIYSFDGERIRTVPYEDLEHFKVMREFMNRFPNPDRKD